MCKVLIQLFLFALTTDENCDKDSSSYNVAKHVMVILAFSSMVVNMWVYAFFNMIHPNYLWNSKIPFNGAETLQNSYR